MRKRSQARCTPDTVSVEPSPSRQPPHLLDNAHTVLRWTDQHGPFAGWLVAASDQQRLLVPDVPDAVWAFAATQHVYAATDLVRTHDGPAAMLEPCIAPVCRWLDGRALHAGEIVTLTLSLLRGLGEVGAANIEQAGEWWLTTSGRPVLVLGRATSIVAHTRELVELVAVTTSERVCERMLRSVGTALDDPLVVLGELAHWEARLVELAAPRSLPVETSAPTDPAPKIGPTQKRDVSVAPTRRVRQRERERHTPVQDRVAAGARALRSLMVLPAHKRNRQPLASSGTTRKRRGPIAIGGGVAALTVLIGVLWPTDDAEATSPTVGHKPRTVSTEAAPAVPGANETAAAEQTTTLAVDASDASHPTDPLEAARALWLEQGGGAHADLAVVEDFGGVVVVRATEAETGVSDVLVLELHNENWLLRETYPVAEQPVIESGD